MQPNRTLYYCFWVQWENFCSLSIFAPKNKCKAASACPFIDTIFSPAISHIVSLLLPPRKCILPKIQTDSEALDFAFVQIYRVSQPLMKTLSHTVSHKWKICTEHLRLRSEEEEEKKIRSCEKANVCRDLLQDWNCYITILCLKCGATSMEF